MTRLASAALAVAFLLPASLLARPPVALDAGQGFLPVTSRGRIVTRSATPRATPTQLDVSASLRLALGPSIQTSVARRSSRLMAGLPRVRGQRRQQLAPVRTHGVGVSPAGYRFPLHP